MCLYKCGSDLNLATPRRPRLVTFLLDCQKNQPVTVTHTVTAPSAPSYENGSNSIHLTLGNPTRATTNQEETDNLLLIKDQYIVSYNKSLGRANWVCWHLQKATWVPLIGRMISGRMLPCPLAGIKSGRPITRPLTVSTVATCVPRMIGIVRLRRTGARSF